MSHDYKINFIELKNSTHYHKIYTDALKSKGKVGYIIITENNTIKKILVPPSAKMTIFSVHATHDPLKHYPNKHPITNNHNNNINNIIYTDSMNITNALSNPVKKNKNNIIRNIFTVYTELHNLNKNVTPAWLIWMQRKHWITKRIINPYLISRIHTSSKNKHQEWMKAIIDNNKPNKDAQCRKWLLLIPSSELTRIKRIILAWLRTGHIKITHEYLIKNMDPLFYNRCQKSLTAQYSLHECTNFVRQTRLHSIHPITALISQNHLKKTLQFLININLYHKIWIPYEYRVA